MRVFLFVLLLLARPALAAEGCHADVTCQLGDRSYHVLTPDGWDGVTPLPVLMHFHGWQRQGTLIVKHQRISGATRRRGVLLVAPNGERKTWDFWRPGSKDVAFGAAVLEDVRKRYPVIEDQIFVSGYSWGSNMAWRFVCERGEGIAALLAISGTLDQDETCATRPGEVRQVYGLNDQVLDFPYGPGGDTTWPVKLWRDAMGCGAGEARGPWRQVEFLTLERTVWEACAHGRVSLDIHPGGHFITHGWIARQLDELLGLPPSYP
ncbi:CE1 family esterase [Ovoidimarina sediminis]|uniref:alpha/beta hydrolase family esterase n=1 Tax=Ovoidimarina sediminis TaxID=3079856 RepID=UPI00290A9C0F|nr:polyhydroxybutyrate depolymerase [Rhodophyticola sp. MJ-SS7]MDU8943955.1 polyhydroxybutyrate depolymerase [Rhodophyticola sp. MJ-SS7]